MRGSIRVGQLGPRPQRRTGVPPLDASVEVVPVVQQPPIHPRPLRDVHRHDRAPGLDEAQEVECPPERSDVARGRDDGDGVTADSCRSNQVTLPADARQIPSPSQACDGRDTRGRAHDDRAISRHRPGQRDLGLQQPSRAALEFRERNSPAGRFRRHDEGRDRAAVAVPQGRVLDRDIAQPELGPALGPRPAARQEGDRRQDDAHPKSAGELDSCSSQQQNVRNRCGHRSGPPHRWPMAAGHVTTRVNAYSSGREL